MLRSLFSCVVLVCLVLGAGVCQQGCSDTTSRIDGQIPTTSTPTTPTDNFARNALLTNLAETIVASWQLAQAGLPVPAGAITLASDSGVLDLTGGEGDWQISGELQHVSWANSSRHILAAARHGETKKLVLLKSESATVQRILSTWCGDHLPYPRTYLVSPEELLSARYW